MKITSSIFQEVLIIEPEVFKDKRGYFFESFNQKNFEDALGRKIDFLQDNESKSFKGVLRGLHFQISPMAQGKLIRVSQGEVFDVALDIRYNSPTFGKYYSIILSSKNKKQLWIPEGFAHGFLSLSDEVILNYKTTNYFSSESSRSIAYNDNDLGINWPTNIPISTSKNDKQAKPLRCFSMEELPKY